MGKKKQAVTRSELLQVMVTPSEKAAAQIAAAQAGLGTSDLWRVSTGAVAAAVIAFTQGAMSLSEFEKRIGSTIAAQLYPHLSGVESQREELKKEKASKKAET